MAGRRFTILLTVAVLGLVSCKSEAEQTRRTKAQAEARVYAAAAARLADEGSWQEEMGDVEQLKYLREARDTSLEEKARYEQIFAEAGTSSGALLEYTKKAYEKSNKDIVRIDKKLKAQRALVVATVKKLQKLEKETQEALAHPDADAALGASVLRDRLSGIQKVLKAANEQLHPDAGAP